MNLGDLVKLDWEPDVLNRFWLKVDWTKPHKNSVFFLPLSFSAYFFSEMKRWLTIFVSSRDDFMVRLSSESL